jgi:tetratricopeptide (TPR) repeat protein
VHILSAIGVSQRNTVPVKLKDFILGLKYWGGILANTPQAGMGLDNTDRRIRELSYQKYCGLLCMPAWKVNMRFSCVVLIGILIASVPGCREKHSVADNNRAIDVEAEISKIKKQLDSNPSSEDSSELHQKLAVLATMKADWSTFESEMSLAIKLDPNQITNYIGAAQVYYDRGMNDKAFAMLDIGVAVDPENPLPHFFLAVFHDRQNDNDKARLEYMETRRLLILLRSAGRLENRIEQNRYYDRHGRTYFLPDSIEAKAEKRISEIERARPRTSL